MKQSHRRHHKLFQDAISVTIPLEVTADMGVALSRTRTKRIKKLKECFPSLIKQEPKKTKETSEESDSGENDSDPTKKTASNTKNMPQRHDYGSVLDYLEAKYVKGVMIQDDEEEVDGDGSSDDDDKRSVYSSESSFLDDSELKRDVVGQVLSQSIQTKVGRDDEDNDDFFVNVGNLEVHDEDNVMDYDPSLDHDVAVKKKKGTKTKKRKRASSVDSNSNTNKSAASKKKKAHDGASATKPMSPKKKAPVVNTKELGKQKEEAEEQKQIMELLQQQIVDSIHNMTDKELPRKKKNTKLSIVVPPGKKAGDSILFSNPHVPGQRLKAKVPKDSQPGEKFIVGVPAPPPPESDNRFSREFQDLCDDFSQAFDEWCLSQSRVDAEFSQHAERMKKFDVILKEFPTNLVTPMDAAYMRKVVRRARQNRHKRKKTALQRQQQEEEEEGEDVHVKKETIKKEVVKKEKDTITMTLPCRGTVFDTVEFKEDDFE